MSMKNNKPTQDYSKEYDGLLDRINKNGGYLTININELRDIHGIIRLTENTCLPIKEALSRRGILSYPDVSKTKSNKIIRLYLETSIAGSIISTLLPENTSKECDDLIRDISMLMSLRECQNSLNIYTSILGFVASEAANFVVETEMDADSRKKDFIKNLKDKLNNKISEEGNKKVFFNFLSYLGAMGNTKLKAT